MINKKLVRDPTFSRLLSKTIIFVLITLIIWCINALIFKINIFGVEILVLLLMSIWIPSKKMQSYPKIIRWSGYVLYCCLFGIHLSNINLYGFFSLIFRLIIVFFVIWTICKISYKIFVKSTIYFGVFILVGIVLIMLSLPNILLTFLITSYIVFKFVKFIKFKDEINKKSELPALFLYLDCILIYYMM